MASSLTQDVSYAGSERNLRLENAHVELVLPTAYGPRVMRYARRDGPNVFAEVSPGQQAVPTAFGDDWHIYGGHRLWSAPEHPVDSYYPDNAPVTVGSDAHSVTLTQPVERHTKLEKSIRVQLHERGSWVSIEHRLCNRGDDPRLLAPWALSAMAPGGLGIYPQSLFRPHPAALAPARPLVLWPFTRMNDVRSSWGDRFILLQQDPGRSEPQKFGCYNDRGYLAYALHGQLFVKCHLPQSGPHADYGCNAQTFANELFLELETLGPEVRLEPGQTVSHREEWFLLDGLGAPPAEPALQTWMRKALDQICSELSAHPEQAALVQLLAQDG